MTWIDISHVSDDYHSMKWDDKDQNMVIRLKNGVSLCFKDAKYEDFENLRNYVISQQQPNQGNPADGEIAMFLIEVQKLISNKKVVKYGYDSDSEIPENLRKNNIQLDCNGCGSTTKHRVRPSSVDKQNYCAQCLECGSKRVDVLVRDCETCQCDNLFVRKKVSNDIFYKCIDCNGKIQNMISSKY